MPNPLERCECGGGAEGNNSKLDSSVCSNHFREIELTSSPTSWKHKIQETDIMLAGSRQEFLPGEPGSNISYGRKGGIFITNAGIVTCLLATVGLCVIVGILVHLYYPTINPDTQKVEDDLSWHIGKLHIRDSEDKIRLLTHVVPTYYRLKIKPNYTNNTFEGNVTISLYTHKSNVKHIAFHAKDLKIENKTIVITEQLITLELDNATNQPKNKVKRYASPDPQGSAQNEDDFKVINNLAKPLTTTPPSTTTLHPNRRLIGHHKSTTTESIPATVVTDVSAVRGNDTKITKIRKKKVSIMGVEFHKDTDRVVLALESHLLPNVNYTLELSFKGTLDETLTGFYRSTFKNKLNKTEDFYVTQFEPISARRAFPCFDEPIFKAIFEISIARPGKASVISNMPLADEEPILGENLTWSHFQRSVPMSPYLVAFVISNMTSVDIPNKNNMDLKIWTREDLQDQTKHAVEVTPKILEFYEKYFGVPYALPKLDLVGIPDFAAGAMENWGMITFKEINILLDPNSDSMKIKKSIAMSIAHELAHQWFGNLVTMEWWTDVWLNEGFATYLEYVAINAIEPQWDLWEHFLLDRMPVMVSDSLESTRAVSNPINDEVDISQVFDEIAYIKASSLLRMLNHILGEEIFRNGLVEYMKAWQYKNAEQSMLWKVFESSINETILPNNTTVADFMNSWTLQSGYPVINVTRNYDNNTVTITQNRFYLLLPPTGMTKELWYVPISYIIGNVSQEFWDTSPKAWLERKQSITLQLPEGSNGTQVYFNVHGIGHYRVNYDKKNWKLLQYQLEDRTNDFPIPTRAQLLDDAFNLARAGQLDYSIALDLTKHMVGVELELLPWIAVLNNLAYIHSAMQRSTEYNAFQDYISRMVMPALDKYGYDNKPQDPAQDSMLRERLIYWACLMEEQECLDWVWNKFNAWRKETNPDRVNPIPFNTRQTIYAAILRVGNQKEFDFMFDRFMNSNDPEVKADIVSALTHTRYPWMLNKLFNYSMTTMDLQLTSIMWSSIEDEIAASTGFNFIMANWPSVFAKLSTADDQILQTVLKSAFGNIISNQQLRQFKRFIQLHKDDLKAATHIIEGSLEKAVLTINWKQNKMEEVERWLVKYKNSNTKDINDLSTMW